MATKTSKYLALALAFYVQFIYLGVLLSFMEYFQTLKDGLNSSYMLLAFIGTCALAISYSVGPIPNILVTLFGYPLTVAMASFVIGVGLALTSIETEAWQMLITYTVMMGGASGILFQACHYMVIDAFDDHEQSFALAVSNSAGGIGLFTLGSIAAYVLYVKADMTWEELFRIYSALEFSVFVFAVFFHFVMPRDIFQSKRTNDAAAPSESAGLMESGESGSDKAKKAADNKSTNMMYLFASNVLAFMFVLVPIIFAVIYVCGANSNYPDLYYYTPISIGLGMFTFRILYTHLFAYCFNAFSIQKFILFSMMVFTAILTGIDATYYEATLVILGLYGGMWAVMFPVLTARTSELLGPYNLYVNEGIQYFALGLATLVGGVTCGAIYDTDANFRWVFMMCAAMFLLALLFDELVFVKYSYCWHLCSSPAKEVSETQ